MLRLASLATAVRPSNRVMRVLAPIGRLRASAQPARWFSVRASKALRAEDKSKPEATAAAATAAAGVEKAEPADIQFSDDEKSMSEMLLELPREERIRKKKIRISDADLDLREMSDDKMEFLIDDEADNDDAWSQLMEREQQKHRKAPPITQKRLDMLDLMMTGRSAIAITSEYKSFYDFWMEVCKRSAEREARRAEFERYGETLGETVLAPHPSAEERRKTVADQKAADDKTVKDALSEAEAAGDLETKTALRDMEREWGTRFALPEIKGMEVIEEEPWKQRLIKRYPNLKWSEIQNELRDTDMEFWHPMEPSPPQWPLKNKPALWARPEASDLEERQEQLLDQFELMIEPPWEMHTSRSVKVTYRGKMQSFKVMIFAGNNNGFGGYSIGRGLTISAAKESAWKRLMNSMMFLPRRHARTLFHDCEGHFRQVKCQLRRRPFNTGNVAPPFGMIVLNGFGLDDVGMTISNGLNPYSWMGAIFEALGQQRSNRDQAEARGLRLYRELDYNDIPLPAPDEAEWDAVNDRVRDAVVDQVYINPITYPERMATPEEKASGHAPWTGHLPYKGFARPWHHLHEKNGKRQFATRGASPHVKAWYGKRMDWQIAAFAEAERATDDSTARNRGK